jgi:hypothetical protein
MRGCPLAMWRLVGAKGDKLAAARRYLDERDRIEATMRGSGATPDELRAALIEHATQNGGRLPAASYAWYGRWIQAGRPPRPEVTPNSEGCSTSP